MEMFSSAPIYKASKIIDFNKVGTRFLVNNVGRAYSIFVHTYLSISHYTPSKNIQLNGVLFMLQVCYNS